MFRLSYFNDVRPLPAPALGSPREPSQGQPVCSGQCTSPSLLVSPPPALGLHRRDDEEGRTLGLGLGYYGLFLLL